jgi:hypothetical protein
MKLKQETQWYRKRLALLLVGGSLLTGMTSVIADVGKELWQQKYNPTSSSWNNGFFGSVGFNADGNVLASGWRGEADSDSAIGIRYDAQAGNVLDTPPEWFLFETTYTDYAADRFTDQHIDSNGNIYFVGMSYAAGWNSFSSRYNVPNIWKYDSAYSQFDRPLWKNYYTVHGNPTDDNGSYYSMAVDGSDNIIAVGYFNKLSSASSGRDWIIDKYDSDGNRVAGFPISFNKDDLNDYAYAVATDSEDNFVVAGSVLIDATADHHNWVVRKYQGDGTLLWETEYDLANGHDQALGVVIDSNDDVIVSGYRRNASPADDNDWYIVKYAKDGDGSGGAQIIWEQSWDDGNSKHGAAYGLLVDSRDDLYIVGTQQRDSADPVYSNRYRPVLQYRDGQTGALLALQNIRLDPTENDRLDIEHDYLTALALGSGNQLVIGGYTIQDGGYTVTRGRTGRVVMLDLEYTVGGNISGLAAGNSVLLQNNGGDDLTISANGSFSFDTALVNGADYAVTVLTQPTSPNQTCTVSNGNGTVIGADVTDIAISCVTNTYTVAGNVAGLEKGNSVVLQNNGGDDLTVSSDGSFTFAAALPDGSSYAVTVLTQPTTPDQTCTVANGTGVLAGNNVTDVTVTCEVDPLFTDVPRGYWAYSWIQTLALSGITTGCTADTYCPEDPVSRAQMAVFLGRGNHGSDYVPPAATGVIFDDVPADYWAASWIEQLMADGVTGGCDARNYCPESTVTRDQMAVFLLRSRHGSSYVPPQATGTLFDDVPVDYWAAPWIEQLANEGITSGCDANNYCPGTDVQRDQMAVFLVRTFGL